MKLTLESLFDLTPTPETSEQVGDKRDVAEIVLGAFGFAKASGVSYYDIVETGLGILGVQGAETEGIVNPVADRTEEEQAEFLSETDDIDPDSVVTEEEAEARLAADLMADDEDEEELN
jgi:hypothetical protein